MLAGGLATACTASSSDDNSLTLTGAEDTGTDTGTDTDAAEDAGPPPLRTPKSLMIALDGVRPDTLAHARTPRMDALIDGSWQAGYQGAYTDVALENAFKAAAHSNAS